jgi:hypothetical protein
MGAVTEELHKEVGGPLLNGHRGVGQYYDGKAHRLAKAASPQLPLLLLVQWIHLLHPWQCARADKVNTHPYPAQTRRKPHANQ